LLVLSGSALRKVGHLGDPPTNADRVYFLVAGLTGLKMQSYMPHPDPGPVGPIELTGALVIPANEGAAGRAAGAADEDGVFIGGAFCAYLPWIRRPSGLSGPTGMNS
jgi:hypothetical protein